MAAQHDGEVVSYTANTDNLEAEPMGEEQLHRAAAGRRFREFIRNFRIGSNYVYRNQLLQRYRRLQPWLEVDLADLNEYDSTLLKLLQDQPLQILPIYEASVKVALEQLLLDIKEEDEQLPDFQIMLKSDQMPRPLRELSAACVSRLVKVAGIIITVGGVRSRIGSIKIQCQTCHKVKVVPAGGGFGGTAMPGGCDGMASNVAGENEPCKSTGWALLSDYSPFIDQQPFKLQESPEAVPTGEMPRSVALSADRCLVDRVSPGMRVSVIGVFSAYGGANKRLGAGATAVRSAFIRVLGFQVEAEGSGRAASSFTPQEEEAFIALSRRPDIYTRLASSIAPAISGDYTVDIKKALICQLMGGSRKTLPDGMNLRGDINILLLGDPSTAKSQFLKFIEKVAPVGVYTSGKGSSAAGLTASVIKDSQGQFCLEGGALVLGDGGIVCIDEFDKMRDTDRVAIHEAMEQQTISIAKAGITTVLNSRASILAAANPLYGRYDDLKSASEQIDLMTTILSRFDLIFIVRDIRDEERDRAMARHVMSIHKSHQLGGTMRGLQRGDDGEIDMATLKKYVSYCRNRCAPRLSQEAAQVLASQYTQIRDEVRRRSTDNNGMVRTVPITVRQLEALVRISESLAKMKLQPEVSQEDVQEAIRLFQVSTLVAVAADTESSVGSLLGTASDEMIKAEEMIKRRMPISSSINKKKMQDELVRQGVDITAFTKAVLAMIKRGQVREVKKGMMLQRVK